VCSTAWSIRSLEPLARDDASKGAGGIHTGRIRVTGKAPDGLTWTIGRKPILVVRGRETELV